jgi:spoIIIJ-associated protein
MENIKSKNIVMEIEGKTVEEAVKKALSILKVPKSLLKIKVLSEEQKGLFGMQGAKPAKISVSVISPGAPKKKA